MEIKHCNVTVMVSDLNDAIRFYTEVLGFGLKNRYGDHWADIEGPGILIGLHPSSSGVRKGDNLQIGCRVADLDKACAELKSKGVSCKVREDDNVHLASFEDPDGNSLYLVQPEW